ncbi:MAG: hypothetical protein F4122_08420 [Gammaproteobacteria bacterium]|nr:hypothetical protein [Gammaproteobacteria bacterium]
MHALIDAEGFGVLDDEIAYRRVQGVIGDFNQPPVAGQRFADALFLAEQVHIFHLQFGIAPRRHIELQRQFERAARRFDIDEVDGLDANRSIERIEGHDAQRIPCILLPARRVERKLDRSLASLSGIPRQRRHHNRGGNQSCSHEFTNKHAPDSILSPTSFEFGWGCNIIGDSCAAGSGFLE